MLNFYDFEVTKADWLVVIINPVEKIEVVIVNDKKKLEKYFYSHEKEIWVGYNNRRYDQYIMKAILLDINSKKVNDWIIKQKKPGWQFSSLFNKIKMINFDTMLRMDTGLKTLEAFMGNDIRETEVPFDIDRKLTAEEINQMIFYCRHDVEQTIEVFLERKAEFDAAMGLVKIFKLPLEYMGKTGAQRVAKILGGRGKKFDDEFEFPIVDTLRLKKYRSVAEWYRNPENHDYKKKQKVIIAGVEHTLAWGGIHGAIKKYYGEGIYLMADVTAYYPSLQEALESGSKDIVINNDLPISDDVEIPADTLVKIKPNVSLVLSQGVNFTNNGTVDNEGIIDSTNGTFTNNGDFSNLNGGKVIGEDGRDEYFVKVKDSSHGTVTSDKIRVAFGDKVKLTINPDEGYELDTIKVINLSDDSEVTLTNYMFEMPESDVEVIATFKALPPTPDTYDGILLYVVIGSISLLGLILGLVSLKKRMN